jgi:hypothetical protein
VHAGIDSVPLDCYEIPDRLREQVVATDPYSVAPFATAEARHCDLDHIYPYQPGIPGQTNAANLAPLSRKAHRLKTHADWIYRRVGPIEFEWTTHAGQRVRVDQAGSHPQPRQRE